MSYLVNDLRTKADSIHRIILGQCYREAINSPDTSTQLGAVIVDKGGIVRYQTLVHNGFVDGWIVTEADYERPRKYVVTEHAERRAIYKAAKAGIALDGSTLYATWAACADCARAIVESGISCLVRHYPPLDEATERWLESVSIGDQIMKNGGVELVDIIGPIPEGFKILRGGEFFDPSI
jgi:dCMP deaminase